MVVGLNVTGRNQTELAGLVTKDLGQIRFTPEGQKKAEELIDKQIDKVFYERMNRFSNQLTQFAKNAYDDQAKLCKTTEKLRLLCNELDANAPISPEETVEMTISTLIEEAKVRQAAVLKRDLKPELRNNLLNVCKKQYEQKELDDATLRRVSHIARIPLFILGTAFQLTKTLFKAIVLSVPAEICTLVTKKQNVRSLAGFAGVKADIAATIGLAMKTLRCFNPPKGTSFSQSCNGIFEVITWERKNKNTNTDAPLLATLSALARRIFGK